MEFASQSEPYEKLCLHVFSTHRDHCRAMSAGRFSRISECGVGAKAFALTHIKKKVCGCMPTFL